MPAIQTVTCFNLRIESLVIESHISRAEPQLFRLVSISELRVLLLRALWEARAISTYRVSISELRVLLLRDDGT